MTWSRFAIAQDQNFILRLVYELGNRIAISKTVATVQNKFARDIPKLLVLNQARHGPFPLRKSILPRLLGDFVSPMKIPLPLRGIRVIREIRGQKKQPRITQISRKNHNESHFLSQWRATGSWKLGG